MAAAAVSTPVLHVPNTERRPTIEEIIDGKKTLEVRVKVPAMGVIQSHQIVRFESFSRKDQWVVCLVNTIKWYESFDEVFENEDPSSVSPTASSNAVVKKQLRSLPCADQVSRVGCLVFRLKVFSAYRKREESSDPVESLRFDVSRSIRESTYDGLSAFTPEAEPMSDMEYD